MGRFVLKRKICFIGTSRATYGYKKNIIKILQRDKNVKCYYVVTGMHLSKKHGYSVNEILKDKISIFKKFKMNYSKIDNHVSFVKSLSTEMQKFSQILAKLKPDILVVTGDRAEMFIAAISAVYMDIPVAHIQAGDLSGHIDGSVRHAITKISHIHFASCQDSAQRVLKMGEQKWRVFNVGAPQLDELREVKRNNNELILSKLNIDQKDNFFLVIFHPVLYNLKSASKQINIILQSVKKYNYKKIIIYPNIDTGNKRIIDIINKFRKKKNYKIIKNLSRTEFLILLKRASILIGNSSVGILEAPTFKTPVLNLGSRQRGRMQANNVVNCDFDEKKIIKSINFILNDKNFKKNLKKCKNPYGHGKSSKKIIRILKNIKINRKLLDKEMTY
jgi:GDP/UDP-N,N'-diacetylbacillosamine 2-epimerase (hydrolysing)